MCGRDEMMHDNKEKNMARPNVGNKISRSEQKRFDEAHRVAFNRMNTPGSVFPTDTLQALHDADLLDLRSPARKAAEAKVLEAAKMRFACCSLATHQRLDSEVRALNDVIASESAPSVEWRAENEQACAGIRWYLRCVVDGKDSEVYPCINESDARVRADNLNSVERGKC